MGLYLIASDGGAPRKDSIDGLVGTCDFTRADDVVVLEDGLIHLGGVNPHGALPDEGITLDERSTELG